MAAEALLSCPAVLGCHGRAVACSGLTAGFLLKTLPRGAYTTARTVGRHSVFEFETHVQRTANSCSVMISDDTGVGESVRAILSNAASLRPLLFDAFAVAMRTFDTEHPAVPNSSELKLTALVVWNHTPPDSAASIAVGPAVPSAVLALQEATSRHRCGLPFDSAFAAWLADAALQPFLVIAHATPLPPRARPPVRVRVCGAPRAHAAAKDSEWVRTRETLESSRPAGVEETLLVVEAAVDLGEGAMEGGYAAGDVLEGTQTNFFALVRLPPSASDSGAGDGLALHTAGTGVLEGTVRRLVLEVCGSQSEQQQQLLQLPVVLRPPTLAQLVRGEWAAAFLTSTSRLVMPIDEVSYWGPLGAAGGGGWVTVPLGPPPPQLTRLEALVAAQVAAHSTRLL